jgi:hypothetical protein
VVPRSHSGGHGALGPAVTHRPFGCGTTSPGRCLAQGASTAQGRGSCSADHTPASLPRLDVARRAMSEWMRALRSGRAKLRQTTSVQRWRICDQCLPLCEEIVAEAVPGDLGVGCAELTCAAEGAPNPAPELSELAGICQHRAGRPADVPLGRPAVPAAVPGLPWCRRHGASGARQHRTAPRTGAGSTSTRPRCRCAALRYAGQGAAAQAQQAAVVAGRTASTGPAPWVGRRWIAGAASARAAGDAAGLWAGAAGR